MGTRVFSIVAYLGFLLAFTYFVLFSAGIIVPKTVDSGAPGPVPATLVFDLGLIAFFGVSHSLLARRSVKAILRRVVPEAAERSLFVAVASLQLATVCALWMPLPGLVWRAPGALATALAVVQALGWGLALASTFMIDHLELFGLRQGLGLASPSRALQTPLAYRLVRHPLYLGMIVGLWSAPALSAGHLLLAAGMTAYIVVGIHHEERDLVRQFGDAYRGYQARVRKLVPVPRREVGP